MDTIAQFIVSNPTVSIVLLVLFCLGGLVNVIIILDKQFGLFGTKTPAHMQKMQNTVDNIRDNHLQHLADGLENLTADVKLGFSDLKADMKEIRTEQGMQGNRLTRVETKLDIK